MNTDIILGRYKFVDVVTNMHKSSNTPIFRNETEVLHDFQGIEGFLAIFLKLEGNEAFLTTDFCLASQNT